MRFRILTFQLYPKYVFEISYKLDLLIENKVNEYLKDFDPGFDLDFSVICNDNNSNDLLLGGNTKHRGKRKIITQQLILPNSYLYFEPDYKFYTNKFDFKLMERGYKTFPLDKYIEFTLTGIELFFLQYEIKLPINIDLIKLDLISYVKLHKDNFIYENEEKTTLREIINKVHWAFHEHNGKKWLESEIGKKWLELASKYNINQKGILELKNK